MFSRKTEIFTPTEVSDPTGHCRTKQAKNAPRRPQQRQPTTTTTKEGVEEKEKGIGENRVPAAGLG